MQEKNTFTFLHKEWMDIFLTFYSTLEFFLFNLYLVVEKSSEENPYPFNNSYSDH